MKASQKTESRAWKTIFLGFRQQILIIFLEARLRIGSAVRYLKILHKALLLEIELRPSKV